MLIGVELLAAGIEALEPVLLQRLHEDGLGELQAVVQADQVLEMFRLLRRLELLLGHLGQGAVEVVDAVDQVLGELLDGVVFCALDLAAGAVLEVAEVGY